MDLGRVDGRAGGRWLAVAGVAAGILVVFVAASGQVDLFLDPPAGAATPAPNPSPSTRQPMMQPPELHPPAPMPLDGPATTVFATVLAILVGLALVAAMAWAAVVLWRIRWRRPQRPDAATVAPLPSVAESVTDDAAAQLTLLEEGEPRNAIVACWQRLEQSIAAAGVPRRPAETSAEYTERVLADLPVDKDMLAGFAELYREARFSVHPMGERARRGALAALRSLHADLADVADVGPLEPVGPA